MPISVVLPYPIHVDCPMIDITVVLCGDVYQRGCDVSVVSLTPSGPGHFVPRSEGGGAGHVAFGEIVREGGLQEPPSI